MTRPNGFELEVPCSTGCAGFVGGWTGPRGMNAGNGGISSSGGSRYLHDGF
jgi:hypothetical protein